MKSHKPIPMRRMHRRGQRRDAAALAAAVLVLSMAAMVTTPLSVARYAASGEGTAAARVAKFEVVEQSHKYAKNAQNEPSWSTGAQKVQLAEIAGTVVDFELPLFDCAYNSLRDLSGAATVVSQNGGLVAAPGTGAYSGFEASPNARQNSNSSNDNIVVIVIHNKSEVAVRFKLELDYNTSAIPAVNGVRMPVYIRTIDRATGASGGFSRLDMAPKRPDGLRNMYMQDHNQNALMGPAGNPYHAGANWNDHLQSDGWFYLGPDQQTGNGAGTVPTVGFQWMWLFHLANSPHNGYTWGDTIGSGGVQPAWNGSAATAQIPHLTNTRANNIDRYDTLLGMEAARRIAAGEEPLKLSLAFRLTVEQVD